MARLIFDFDGTTADSMWVIMSIYEELLDEKIDPTQIERIRGTTASKVIKELKIPILRAPLLMARGKKIMHAKLHEVKPFDGMPELIKKLHKDGHRLEIMSSNSEMNVRAFLLHHKLQRYFTNIRGGVGLFGKAPVLKKLLKQSLEKTYYIGDEARDIDAAKKAHVPIISVGWGYNNEKLLRSLDPDYFVYKPKEILKLLKGK